MKRSLFRVDDVLGPERLTAREVMRQLGVRSRRTLVAYVRRGILPPGERVRIGRSYTRRTWTDQAVNDAAVALAVNGLPGPQARRLDDCRERGIQQRRAKRNLADLAFRVVRELGACALAEALRPLGLDSIGLDTIAPARRAAVRMALSHALGGQP